jgi:hypothetical protein
LAVNVLEDNIYATTFFDKDGLLRVQATGHYVVEYVNATTGASVVVNTSGPVFVQ